MATHLANLVGLSASQGFNFSPHIVRNFRHVNGKDHLPRRATRREAFRAWVHEQHFLPDNEEAKRGPWGFLLWQIVAEPFAEGPESLEGNARRPELRERAQ